MSEPIPHESDAPHQDRRRYARGNASYASHHDAIFTLARASEIHDEDTGTHVLRIRMVVEQIALHMNFSPDDARELGFDAMLHDVGKLRIPPEVLQKPGQLNEHERLVMESHTVCGERLLSDRTTMQRASRIARSHHENWNGSGYPDGLPVRPFQSKPALPRPPTCSMRLCRPARTSSRGVTSTPCGKWLDWRARNSTRRWWTR